MTTTFNTATAAKSASSCAGAANTAAHGSATGSPASPKREAKPQPTSSMTMQRANGARAIAESLATGDDDVTLALVLRVIAVLWVASIVLGLVRGCAA